MLDRAFVSSFPSDLALVLVLGFGVAFVSGFCGDAEGDREGCTALVATKTSLEASD